MKLIKQFIIYFLILILGSDNLHGQDSLRMQPKNLLYANLGIGGWSSAASLNYERQLFTSEGEYHVNYYVRASGGTQAYYGTGPYGSICLQGVFGEGKSHLEFGLGMAVLYNKGGYERGVVNASNPGFQEPSKMDYIRYTPSGSIGYRFQKPSSGFVFRTGLAYPEVVYLSFGWAF